MSVSIRSFSHALRMGQHPLLFGMIHVPALPGSPLSRLNIGQLVDRVSAETEIYAECGIDGIIVENMHDLPYQKETAHGPEVCATMARLCTACAQTLGNKRRQKMLLGVQILAGANRTALAVAQAAGFDFIRAEAFVFSHVADEGWMDGCAGELLRYRRAIGADRIGVVADIKKKHCSHAITADVSVAETAHAAEFFLADGVILSGASTGEAACPDELNGIRLKCSIPVLIGSGIDLNNVDLFNAADGFIVGSNFKKDGNWKNEIERTRIEKLVDKVWKMEKKKTKMIFNTLSSKVLPNGAAFTKIAQPFFRRFSSTTEAFERAQKELKKLKEEPDNNTKLELYALFKQANEGDVRGERPKMLEFVARAKFDAWEKVKGMSKSDAQHKYAEFVNVLMKNAGITVNSSVDAAKPPAEKESDGLRLQKDGKAFKIELNRPDKFNAITWEMYDGLTNALCDASADRETSVTVITGVGPYFCAGNDLSNFTRGVKTGDDLRTLADRAERVLERYVRAFIEHEKPLIGLINGPAIGISVTVLPLFDLVIASDKATFHTPFSSLGQSPEGCSSYTFPMIMGTSKACEVLLFDKKLSAEEALERNLVSRVIPNDSFRIETERMVNSLASLPPESLRLNKTLLRDVHRAALLAVNERECALLKSRWLSDECQRALQKFMARKSGGE